MVRSSKLVRRRYSHHLIEPLEERRLLSLAIDMRVDVGNAANTDPSTIINAHAISGAKVGDVYAVQIWAEVSGSDSDGTNDTLDLLYGSLIASDLRSGGYFGSVQGTFAVPTLQPYFASTTYEASTGSQYTDGNGNIDIGTTDNSTLNPQLYFHPVADVGGSSTPTTNLIGQGSAGAGEEEELATTTFTVTQVVDGPPVTLEFQLRPQITGEVSAIWYEDGTPKDTLDGDAVGASTGITVTEPDTIAPTASASLSPILGSTSSYQFTVDYADNQDLNTSDFGNNNILVTGPNGYSQLATYVSDVDADPSADPQYDPYNATYQITPPDADGAWGIADNGAYTFTLEPNQIADNSGNYAASGVLGGGPLDVQFLGAVSISPAAASIGENSSTPATFTVTRTDGLNDNYAEPMTVAYTVAGTGTAPAVAGTNFTALSGSLTIPAGQSSATIPVQPIDDNSVDADTSLALTINNGSTYVLGSPTGAALTIDNTDTVAASIANEAVARSESNQVVDFPVTLSAAAAVTVYVDYSTSDGTATAGTDYEPASGQLVFDPGSTTPETPLAVTVLGSTNSGDKTFNVNLTVDPQSTADVTLANATAVGTISDVIPASLSPLTPTIAPTINNTTAVFSVTLATPSTQTVTVNYATADGSALAGTDYTATSGTLSFAPGQTTQTIDVPILPVIQAGGTKTFSLSISAGTLTSVDSSSDAATLTLEAPDLASLPINAKTGATYTDAAGNKVVVKVSGAGAGFSGNILFPTGGPTTGVDAVGIVLNGTTAKSTLTITTKSTTLDFIDDNGSLKAVSAKGVNLAQSSQTSIAPYFTTTGSATTITLGSLAGATLTSSSVKTLKAGNLTGATVNISGGTVAKMAFANIQDCQITDAASLSSFSANQWLNTDSTADLLSVAGLNSLTAKGNFQANVSAGIVGTVSVKGTWSNSLIEATSVKKMSVGAASNSDLLASLDPNAAFPPSSSDLSAGGQITSFSVTSKAANAFSSTRIEGQYLGTLALGSINPDNSGNLFGVATQSIKSITLTDSTGKHALKNLNNSISSTPISEQDFVVELIS